MWRGSWWGCAGLTPPYALAETPRASMNPVGRVPTRHCIASADAGCQPQDVLYVDGVMACGSSLRSWRVGTRLTGYRQCIAGGVGAAALAALDRSHERFHASYSETVSMESPCWIYLIRVFLRISVRT